MSIYDMGFNELIAEGVAYKLGTVDDLACWGEREICDALIQNDKWAKDNIPT